VPLGKVIGGQLGGQSAPSERQSGGDHRHDRGRAADHAQQIRQQARGPQAEKHERDLEGLRGVGRAARGSRQRDPDHAQQDRGHRQVLMPSGVLVEQALGEEHQRHQPGRQRRLHDDQRRQQQGHDLKRPAQDRQAGAGEPAGTPEQVPDERHAEVLLAGRLLGVHRLKGDP